MSVTRGSRSCALALAVLTFAAGSATAQQLGQKVLAGVGIDAGTQPLPGLYAIDKFIYFTSEQARDRNGNVLPIKGLDIDAFGDAFGLGFITKPKHLPYLNFAASIPFARIHVSIDDPETSLDNAGLSDIFVQPLKVGWRGDRHDIVAGYSFYAPSGKFLPRAGGGVGRGNWTHQFAAGGAYYTSKLRGSRASVLATFEVNSRKRDIDIRRGNMFQIQGGAGASIRRMFTVGVAGYALWQVSDDTGDDVPVVLRGARTRVYGLGPEVDVAIPAIKMRFDLRLEWDFGVRSRPEGKVWGGGVAYQLWAPGDGAVKADK